MDTLTHVPGVDDRREYRNDLLSVSAVVLTAMTDGGRIVTDKEIMHSIEIADRLIRGVNKFVGGKVERAAPLQLADIDADTE